MGRGGGFKRAAAGKSLCDNQPDVPHCHGVLGKGIIPRLGEQDTREHAGLINLKDPHGISVDSAANAHIVLFQTDASRKQHRSYTGLRNMAWTMWSNRLFEMRSNDLQDIINFCSEWRLWQSGDATILSGLQDKTVCYSADKEAIANRSQLSAMESSFNNINGHYLGSTHQTDLPYVNTVGKNDFRNFGTCTIFDLSISSTPNFLSAVC